MLRFARPRRVAAVALFGLLVASVGPVSAQPAAKKTLAFADYDIWRAPSGATPSRDGAYVAYLLGTEGGDGEAVVRHVASGKEYRFPRGAPTLLPDGTILYGPPRFSPDGKTVLLPLAPTKAAVEKAKADKVPASEAPKPALAIVSLPGGELVERVPNVGAFQVGGAGAGFVAYREPNAPDVPKPPAKGATPPPKGKAPLPTPDPPADVVGTDLFIRDLAAGTTRTVLHVTEYTLAADETALVYAVASKGGEKNGVYALNPKFGTGGAPLHTGPGRSSKLTWDHGHNRLAFLYDDSRVPLETVAPPPRPAGTPPGTPATTAPAAPPEPRYRVFVWDRRAKAAEPLARVPVGTVGGFGALVAPVVAADPRAAVPVAEVFGPSTSGLRKGWALHATGLAFSHDGTKLYVATAPQRAPQPPEGADALKLDIWHWKDGDIQPMQQARAAEERRTGRARTYGAVVLLDTKQFRQLSDDGVSVQPPAAGDWAVSADERKYRFMTGYASPLPNDAALVNVRTGETRPLATASTVRLSLSPSGKFALGFDGKDWFTHAVPDGKKVNLTAKLGVKFFDEEFDSPSAPPAYGAAAWLTDGKHVLVSDRYDIWKLAADGSGAENLTRIGRAQGVRFALLRPRSPDDRTPIEREIDLSKPHLLGAENLATRDTGFYRLDPGAAPKMLVMGARKYGEPTRAKDAGAYLLTVQTFAQYPDYYVTTPDFHELKRVTDINPKVKEYNWGTAELVKYTSTDGTPLQGVLVKPENFDPAKKYPLVVYIYERLSDNLHQFRVPTVTRGQVINPTFYASNGYLVLMPDIAYTVGAPGPSALKCVLPAIQAVVDKGCVNEKAIGINGQSWGGYQIAYMVTQTTRFKAAVAGAPVANMVSAYDGIRWGTGLPRQFQYEKTQSRIGGTPWEVPLKYIENSPVFMADRVQTPLLMIHNDQDDAVPWYQGIEYFLALRRLGREVYLLNYNGQPHNLTNKTAARDFAMRMFQFFEHHLREKAAPEWMEKGVPFSDREKEKEQWKKLYGK